MLRSCMLSCLCILSYATVNALYTQVSPAVEISLLRQRALLPHCRPGRLTGPINPASTENNPSSSTTSSVPIFATTSSTSSILEPTGDSSTTSPVETHVAQNPPVTPDSFRSTSGSVGSSGRGIGQSGAFAGPRACILDDTTFVGKDIKPPVSMEIAPTELGGVGGTSTGKIIRLIYLDQSPDAGAWIIITWRGRLPIYKVDFELLTQQGDHEPVMWKFSEKGPKTYQGDAGDGSIRFQMPQYSDSGTVAPIVVLTFDTADPKWKDTINESTEIITMVASAKRRRRRLGSTY